MAAAIAPAKASSVPPRTNINDEEDIEKDVKEFDNTLARGLARALDGSADLSNMLPTGTVLLFQILDPIVRRAGTCQSKGVSAAFLAVCSLVCFVLSFTDSFQASNGKVYYGFATVKGLWIPQLKQPPPGLDVSKYKLSVGDFVHAVLAVYLFLTTTAISTDVVRCFFTVPDEVARAVPSASAFLVSAVFVLFPTTRHGIGFPVRPPAAAAASKTQA